MTVELAQHTQQRLIRRMATRGHSTLDEMINSLLDETADEVGDWDDLDPETRAAIAEGEAEADRGEGIPWEQVRAELVARYDIPQDQ